MYCSFVKLSTVFKEIIVKGKLTDWAFKQRAKVESLHKEKEEFYKVLCFHNTERFFYRLKEKLFHRSNLSAEYTWVQILEAFLCITI